MTPPGTTGTVTTTTAPQSVTTTTGHVAEAVSINLRHDLMGLLTVLVLALLVASALILALVLVRRAWHVLRTLPHLSRSAYHFEILPRGNRPVDYANVAGAAAAALETLAASRRARCSLHWVSDGKAVFSALSVAGMRGTAKKGSEAVASSLARAVGAECRPLPQGWTPPATRYMAYAQRSAIKPPNPFSPQTFDLGILPAEVVQRLSAAGGPAFLTLTVKPVSTRERNALWAFSNAHAKRWQENAGVAQPMWRTTPFLMRGMLAAGAKAPDITSGLVSGLNELLPLYESRWQVISVSDRFPGAIVCSWFCVLGASMAAVGHFLPSVKLEHDGIVVGAIGLLTTALALSNVPSLSFRAMRRWLSVGVLPVPPRPFVSVPQGIHGGAQNAAMTHPNDDSPSRWHPYRLVRRLLVMVPGQFAALACLPPASSTATGTTAARSVNAPNEVREARGARLGYDASGVGVQVPDRNRTGHIFVVGDPGQGKSSALLSVFASDLLRRAELYREVGELTRAVVWVETKGEGAARTLAVARQVGYPEQAICYIDTTSADGPQLDLVDRSDPFASAQRLAEAMRYAFSDRSILDESEETLKVVFALALAITAEVLADAGLDPYQGFMRTAFQLLGGDPVADVRNRLDAAVQKRLGIQVVTSTGGRHRNFAEAREADPLEVVMPGATTPLGIAWRNYRSKIRSRQSDTEGVFAAPKNKVHKLLEADTFWRDYPNRRKVTPKELISKKAVVVVNTGGRQGFSDELRGVFGGMFVYCFWHDIKEVCDDWERRGWSISIFSDELGDIAGTGYVIHQMFDSGRSRGLWLNVATQRFDKLPDDTRNAALSASTKVYLRQENREAAVAGALDLVGLEEGSFTATDLRRLPPMVGVCREHVGDTMPAAFSIHIVHDEMLTPAQLASGVIQGSEPLQAEELVK